MAARRGRDQFSEERLQLLGRPGQQDDDARLAVEGGRKKLAGRAAVGVGQQRRTVEDVGLLGVVGRHGDAAGGEALVQPGEQLVVGLHADAERGGNGLARQVVFGGSEAAREHDDVGTGECDAGRAGKMRKRVADNGLEGYLHAQIVQLLREEERVRVLPERRQHFGAGGDNFSDHSDRMRQRTALLPATAICEHSPIPDLPPVPARSAPFRASATGSRPRIRSRSPAE